MIKSFRGKIADGGQDRIPLSSRTGATGYRIVKFNIIPELPIASDAEMVTKIYKIKQTAFSSSVDFNDSTLLAVGVWWGGTTGIDDPQDWIQIFDQEIFNQDIYVSGSFSGGTFYCNYYLELEVMRLDMNENTVATLKDIRNTKQ